TAFHPEGDEVVIDGSRNQGLQPIPYHNIGRRLAVLGIDCLAEGKNSIRGHILVNIGVEGEALAFALARDGHPYREERRVVHLDPVFLDGRDQIVIAIVFAPQNGGEELYQPFATNRRTMIEPSTVAADPD